jgi:hypothetical protein
MSAFGDKADMGWTCFDIRLCPKADMSGLRLVLSNMTIKPHFAGRKSLL